jgi:hypothetical protein
MGVSGGARKLRPTFPDPGSRNGFPEIETDPEAASGTGYDRETLGNAPRLRLSVVAGGVSR